MTFRSIITHGVNGNTQTKCVLASKLNIQISQANNVCIPYETSRSGLFKYAPNSSSLLTNFQCWRLLSIFQPVLPFFNHFHWLREFSSKDPSLGLDCLLCSSLHRRAHSLVTQETRPPAPFHQPWHVGCGCPCFSTSVPRCLLHNSTLRLMRTSKGL